MSEVEKATEGAGASAGDGERGEGKLVRFIVDAGFATQSGEGPVYAVLNLSGAMVKRLQDLVALCKAQELNAARISGDCLWGPDGIEDMLRLQRGEIVVTGSGKFWFTDYTKGQNVVETAALDLESVRDLHWSCLAGTTVMLMKRPAAQQAYAEDQRLGAELVGW